MPRPTPQLPEIAVIIPAYNEEPVLGCVLEELLKVIRDENMVVAVGVNGSSDGTATVAREHRVLVGETAARGYGYGCVAAIDRVIEMAPSVRAFLFFAADGASDPRDLRRLIDAWRSGFRFVLGTRTTRSSNWHAMTLRHVIANLLLGAWCRLLGGHWSSDLGPLRLIERDLFATLDLQEMTYGWTIEAQIVAARLGVAIKEVPVAERRRLAGEQKVSGVTWRRTLEIGCRILAAGLRSRRRVLSVSPAALIVKPAYLTRQFAHCKVAEVGVASRS